MVSSFWFPYLLFWAVWTDAIVGKYVGSRPITIKKATTGVEAVNIGEKKAKKIEKEAKEKAKSGVQRSGKGLGSAANYKGLGPAACKFLFTEEERSPSNWDSEQILDVDLCCILLYNLTRVFKRISSGLRSISVRWDTLPEMLSVLTLLHIPQWEKLWGESYTSYQSFSRSSSLILWYRLSFPWTAAPAK